MDLNTYKNNSTTDVGNKGTNRAIVCSTGILLNKDTISRLTKDTISRLTKIPSGAFKQSIKSAFCTDIFCIHILPDPLMVFINQLNS